MKTERAQSIAQLIEAHKQTSQLLFRCAQMTPDGASTLSTVRVLKLLKGGDTKTQHELADTLCISGGAMSRHVTALLDKGYVQTTVNRENRRETHISLTEAGAEALKAAEQALIARFVELLEPMSDEELAAIIAANAKLQQTITKQL